MTLRVRFRRYSVQAPTCQRSGQSVASLAPQAGESEGPEPCLQPTSIDPDRTPSSTPPSQRCALPGTARLPLCSWPVDGCAWAPCTKSTFRAHMPCLGSERFLLPPLLVMARRQGSRCWSGLPRLWSSPRARIMYKDLAHPQPTQSRALFYNTIICYTLIHSSSPLFRKSAFFTRHRSVPLSQPNQSSTSTFFCLYSLSSGLENHYQPLSLLSSPDFHSRLQS